MGLAECGANANLISAAPDMLVALYALHEAFVKGEIKFAKRRQSDSDPYHPANTLMSKAIAKAEGRAVVATGPVFIITPEDAGE